MDPLPPGSQMGSFPYYIHKRLNEGQGGMSEVYLATVGHPAKQQPSPARVVLKVARVLDKHEKFHYDALDNEVARLRRLKHPGIVRIYPIHQKGIPNLPYRAQAPLEGNPWFSVMEYLPGSSLADLIQQKGQLEVELALEIGRNLAATLDYLHNREQVHLDIKPENILFRSDPLGPRLEPVLIDFGITRDIGQSGLEARTLVYCAPERFQEGTLPHPSMDIYSLGVVLYHMLTGRLPFQRSSELESRSAIVKDNPTSPSTYQPALPAELNELILKTIHKDPLQRPTAEELAVALESVAIKLGFEPGQRPGVSFLLDPVVGRPSEPAIWMRRPLLSGLLGLVTALLMFTLGFAMRGSFSVASEFNPGADTSATSALAGTSNEQDTFTPTGTLEAMATATFVPVEILPPVTYSPAETEESTPTSIPKLTPLTRSTPSPTSTFVPTPTKLSPLVVTLVEPKDGASGSGEITFLWSANHLPSEGQFFELVFWQEGQNKLDPAQSPGVAELTRGSQARVGITELVEDRRILNHGDYYWGIVLVEKYPYRRLDLVSGQRRFRVD